MPAVDQHRWLEQRFETHREQLRSTARRMLGSAKEADSAVRDAELRLGRPDVTSDGSLTGCLATVVARVCLDRLRAPERRGTPHHPRTAALVLEPADSGDPGGPPATDSVGLALLVVLDALPPAERLTFLLHEMFAVPVEEVAAITDRSHALTRELVRRARRRVRGTDSGPFRAAPI